MSKSVFRGIKRHDADLLRKNAKVGELATLRLTPLGSGCQPTFLTSAVKWITVFPHGTMVLFRGSGEMKAWEILPVWLSKDGCSGVLCIWKEDAEMTLAIDEYKKSRKTKKVSLLVEGNIPAGTPCPWALQCTLRIDKCPTTEKIKEVPFSCGAARFMDIFGQSPDPVPIA